MRRLSHLLGSFLIVSMLLCGAVSAQTGGDSGDINSSILLVQADIGGETVMGTAFVVKSGENCMALTSFETVAGAAVIRVLVPGEGLIDAHLAKFAPEANLALLEIPSPNIPAVRIGDYELLRQGTPLNLICSEPVMDGSEATSCTYNIRPGTLQSTISRPSGAILRVGFSPGIEDQSSGAPIIIPTTGEVVAVSLSLETSQVDTLRFAVPAHYVVALCPELAAGAEIPTYIRVRDGSEAPVKKGSSGSNANGYSTGVYVAVIGGAVLAVVVLALVLRKKKHKVVPFSNLPSLPEGKEMGFFTAEGKLLPDDADVIKIGRSPDNDWCFPEPTVSNFHARIRKNKSNGHYEVEDIRSSNGTFVGKRRIASATTVTPGTIVRFGKKIEVKLVLRTQTNDPLAQLGLKKK